MICVDIFNIFLPERLSKLILFTSNKIVYFSAKFRLPQYGYVGQWVFLKKVERQSGIQNSMHIQSVRGVNRLFKGTLTFVRAWDRQHINEIVSLDSCKVRFLLLLHDSREIIEIIYWHTLFSLFTYGFLALCILLPS